MKYEVLITPSAKADILEIHTWLLGNYSEYAESWLWGISQAITTLSRFPTRLRISPESDVFDVLVRELLYGRRPNAYRILFSIEEERVYVLRVRSTRQQSLWNEIEHTE